MARKKSKKTSVKKGRKPVKKPKTKFNLRETQRTTTPSGKTIFAKKITAFENKKNIGHIDVDIIPERHIMQHENGKDDLYIRGIYVRPKYRDKGVGGDLIKKAERIAKQNKKKRLILDVLGSNNKAQRFYKRHGFEMTNEVKEITIRQGNKSKLFLMVKEL